MEKTIGENIRETILEKQKSSLDKIYFLRFFSIRKNREKIKNKCRENVVELNARPHSEGVFHLFVFLNARFEAVNCVELLFNLISSKLSFTQPHVTFRRTQSYYLSVGKLCLEAQTVHISNQASSNN